MLHLDHIDKTAPVLLVEDKALIATDIEHMLLDLGFEKIEVCLTHKAASAQAAKGGFGLAIFDVNVGGMLSFGLISNVMAQNCPVVTISGYIDGVGADDGRVFLAKPIDEKRLAGAIRDVDRISMGR